MNISRWCEVGWLWGLLGIIASIYIVKRSLRHQKSRIVWDRIWLRLPKIGKVVVMTEIARFTRTMELLIKSGISLVKAVQIAVPVINNLAMRLEVENSSKFIEEGGNFSDVLHQSSSFPLFVTQLVKIGEESGKLDETLLDIADWYEQETAESIKIMTDLLEPAIILLVGLILGFIIVAVLLPIFSMNAMVS